MRLIQILVFTYVVLFLMVGAVEGRSDEYQTIVPAKYIHDKIVAEMPVDYNNVLIEGDLDLRGLNLPTRYVGREWADFELSWSEVLPPIEDWGAGLIAASVPEWDENAKIVYSPINIRNSAINGSVYFNNTIFEQPINFEGTKFSGSADFLGAQFTKETDFLGAQFAGKVDFRGSQFGEYVDFLEARFNGYADFRGANFSKGSRFMHSKFLGWEIEKLKYGELERSANFWDAHFGDGANFLAAQFTKAASFARVDFNGSTCFECAEFCGDADFGATKFFGGAGFFDAYFGGEANFIGANFFHDALFSCVNFSKEIKFRNTNFDGYMYFYGSRFEKDADFSSATLGKNGERVCFEGTYFMGNVRFISSRFVGDADFENADFRKDANFILAQFYRNAQFNNARFAREADFSQAQFSDNRNFGAFFSNCSFIGPAIFDNVKFSETADFRYAYFTNSLNLTHSRFDRMEIRWNSVPHWICDEVVYIALTKNFRDLAQFDDADDCYYQYRRSYQARKKLLEKDGGDLSKLIDVLAWVSCGYGVRPSYTLVCGLSFIFFFGLVFWASRSVQKISPPYQTIYAPKYTRTRSRRWISDIARIQRRQKSTKGRPLSFTDALYFSTLVFISLSSPEYQPVGRLRYAVIVERLLGWLLLALLLVTLGHVMIR